MGLMEGNVKCNNRGERLNDLYLYLYVVDGGAMNSPPAHDVPIQDPCPAESKLDAQIQVFLHLCRSLSDSTTG